MPNPDRTSIDTILDTSRLVLEIEDRPDYAGALQLCGLVHVTRDRGAWGGFRYWEQLPARILLGTYRSTTVAQWWEQMTRLMGCIQPTHPDDRALLAALSATGMDGAVLDQLSTATQTLCLRVRVAFDAHKAASKEDV